MHQTIPADDTHVAGDNRLMLRSLTGAAGMYKKTFTPLLPADGRKGVDMARIDILPITLALQEIHFPILEHTSVYASVTRVTTVPFEAVPMERKGIDNQFLEDIRIDFPDIRDNLFFRESLAIELLINLLCFSDVAFMPPGIHETVKDAQKGDANNDNTEDLFLRQREIMEPGPGKYGK